MTAWRALYEQHRELRGRPADLVAAVRRRLVVLAERGHCAPTIQGRFTRRDLGGLREWFIQPDGMRADQEPLTRLPRSLPIERGDDGGPVALGLRAAAPSAAIAARNPKTTTPSCRWTTGRGASEILWAL